MGTSGHMPLLTLFVSLSSEDTRYYLGCLLLCSVLGTQSSRGISEVSSALACRLDLARHLCLVGQTRGGGGASYKPRASNGTFSFYSVPGLWRCMFTGLTTV